MPGERVVRAPLDELPDRIAAAGLKAPVLIVIGRVVEAMVGCWRGDDRSGQRPLQADAGRLRRWLSAGAFC